MSQISVEALGHTFHIMPGVEYSLGTDDTFAIKWQDRSITTYRITGDTGMMEYFTEIIPAEECTADLSTFTPFFPQNEPEYDGYVDDWREDDMTDIEADADTLKSCGMGTDEDYGCFGSNEEMW